MNRVAPDRAAFRGPPVSLERRTDLAFGVLVVFAGLLGPFYAVGVGGPGPVLAGFLLSIAILAVGLPVLRGRGGRPRRVLLAFLLGTGVGVFYDMTGALLRQLDLPLWDDVLLSGDAFFLGWALPDGQIAAWLDRSTVLGPQSLPGRVLTEVLQVSYVSYYAWGFALLILLVVRYVRASEPEEAVAWRRIGMFLCAWLGAYLANYLMYVLVPAMGPWFAFPDLYQHELQGLWLTESLRSFVQEHQVTPDCFPSGHTALSWITVIVALRFAPRYGRIAFVAAALITVATVCLRYHYLVDVVAAIPLIAFGLFFGGFWPHRGPCSPVAGVSRLSSSR